MKKIWIAAFMIPFAVACSGVEGEKAETGDAEVVVTETKGDAFAINVASSKIEWEGTKPTGTHHGTVDFTEGTLQIEEGNVIGGKFTADMNSIVDLDLDNEEFNQKLVNHLKSGDFFAADQFPTSSFEIVSVSVLPETDATGGDIQATHEVKGNLTIRDITKSITFKAQILVNGDMVTVYTPQFVIDRTLWGVNFKSKTIDAKFKDDFIADEIGLSINLIAKKSAL